MKKIIKLILIFFYSHLINIWLFFLSKIFKKKLFYSKFISFGDTYLFCIKNYLNIIKNKEKKVVIFGGTDSKIISLLFEKKKYIKNIFYIFDFFPDHGIHSKLRNLKYFEPALDCDYKEIKNKDSIKNLINININKKKISKKILEYNNSSYFLMFIKHYNNNINDLSGSSGRQTSDLNKIYELILYLINKNKEVIIMGNDFDKSVAKIKKFNFGNLNSKVKFFLDLTENYSLYDQLYLINNSIGYVGNASGFAEPVHYQKKTAVIFDAQFDKSYLVHSDYRKYLYKSILINEKLYTLDAEIPLKLKNEPNLKYQVLETPLSEIKAKIDKNFF